LSVYPVHSPPPRYIILTLTSAHSRAFFCLHSTPPPHTYTLSLHDALPISVSSARLRWARCSAISGALTSRIEGIGRASGSVGARSEEHTSELQSRFDLVCRLLLEKKKEGLRARLAC